MKPTYTCDLLIVDDQVNAAALPSFPQEVSVTVVNTIAEALEKLGVDPSNQLSIPVSRIQHNYDIVFLDFQLLPDDMKNYPMGGLSLHSLFKAAFTPLKPGDCIVCCYSDKMANELPKARYLFELTERKMRNQDGVVGLHQSGVKGIDRKPLYQAKAESILSEAPFAVFVEIAERWVDLGKEGGWDQPLIYLSDFLEVQQCSLNQLLLQSGSPTEDDCLWLRNWLARKSLSQSMAMAYRTITKFAHLPKGQVQLIPPIVWPGPEEISSGLSLPSIGRYCIPKEVAEELDAIAKEDAQIPKHDYTEVHGQNRCMRVKNCFRLALKSHDTNKGFTLDDLMSVDDIGKSFVFHGPVLPPESVSEFYVYTHPSIMASQLRGLYMALHNHDKVTDDHGRLICNIRVMSDLQSVMFSVRQRDSVTAEDACRIAKDLVEGKPWGPFPEIISWGAVWIGVENGAVYEVMPGYARSLGLDTPVLCQGEFALVLSCRTA